MYWFEPDALRQQEASEQEAVRQGTFDGRGHFGSYCALLSGNHAFAAAHSYLTRSEARAYAREIRWRLGSTLSANPSILDVGCGPGAITDALRHVFLAKECIGLDIAQAAIQYATSHYAGCTFQVQGIARDTNLQSQFDLVHCREFYPFTRTDDAAIHHDYLSFCRRHLRLGGALVLSQVQKASSLLDTFSRLDFGVLGLTPFHLWPACANRLRQVMPPRLAQPLTRLLCYLRRQRSEVIFVSYAQEPAGE